MALTLLALFALQAAAAPPAPAKPGLSPAAELDWNRCVQKDAAVTAAVDRRQACDQLLARTELDPRQRALAYYWRALSFTELDAAIADIERALAVTDAPATTRSTLYRARGSGRLAQKRPAEARADFDRAVQLDAGNVDALFERAKLHFSEKRYAEARADTSAMDGYPASLTPEGHARLHLLRGAAYVAEKNEAAALPDYNRAVEVAPKFANAYYVRGEFASDQKRYEDALSDYVKTTELAPRNGQAFNSLCWVLAARLKREFDRARTACDTALSLEPKDANIHDSAGLVALQQKRWQDAWKHYDDAARLMPGRAPYLYGRGLAALRLGRSAAGDADIAAAIKADPTVGAEYAGYGQKP